MGISMAGADAFSYNRFDALNDAYRSLYEEKCKEDDVSDEEEAAIKKEVKGHAKDMHSDDDEDEDDEDEDDEDEEKSDKKFPSFLKKSKGEKVEETFTDKGNRLIDAYDRPPYSDDEDKRDPKKMKIKGKLPKGTVKEEVIAYLMDEGFVNNEVSAEVMAEHMSSEWMEEIVEVTKTRAKKAAEREGRMGRFNIQSKSHLQGRRDEDEEDEADGSWDEVIRTQKSVKEETTKFDERGRPKSGPYNVYKKDVMPKDKRNAGGKDLARVWGVNQDSNFQAAVDRVRANDKKKTPEQRKKELDAYKERQANR